MNYSIISILYLFINYNIGSMHISILGSISVHVFIWVFWLVNFKFLQNVLLQYYKYITKYEYVVDLQKNIEFLKTSSC